AGHAAGGHRLRHRARRRAGCDPLHDVHPLPRQPHRPADVLIHQPADAARCGARLLCARAPGFGRGPHSHAAPRVNAMRTIFLTFTAVFALSAADPDAEALIRNGHWKRARDAAEAAHKARPDDARTAWLLARVRKEFQQVDEAVKLAEQAVKLDPKVAACHLTLAEAYEDQINRISVFKQLGLSHKIRAELDA